MSGGVPMGIDVAREIIEIVRAAAGHEICAAVDAAFAVSPCEGMSDEERACWIVGEGRIE